MQDWIVTFYFEDDLTTKLYDEFFTAKSRFDAIVKARNILPYNAIIVETKLYI